MTSHKARVLGLYRQLYYLGADYPKGSDYFRQKLREVFNKNRGIADTEQQEMLVARGEYVVKELEALYKLKKYRTLKKRYYPDS